jgi:putative hydrolase of the HAD superfamily
MIGNSLRSDVLPVVAIGARAYHIPYAITWAHEAVAARPDASFETLADLRSVLG